MLLAPLLFGFLSTTLPGGESPAKRPMTVDDGLRITGIGDVRLSPDGEHVFYSLSDLDWGENERTSRYFLVPTAPDGEPAREFVGDSGGSAFQFTPDGRYLSMQRKAEETTQVFWMHVDGGEAVQLTKHAQSIRSHEWSDDATRLFFVADRPKSKEEEAAEKAGDDVLWVDEGPNGQTAGRWSRLMMLDIESGEETLLVGGDHVIGSFDPSPDGTRVAFTARTENRRNQRYLSEIFVVDVDTRAVRQLTTNRAPEGRVQWAPCGEHMLFGAPDDEEWELRLEKLWSIDAETGEIELLSGAFEGNIRAPAWSPDCLSIYFAGQQGIDTGLFRLDNVTGDVEELSGLSGSAGSVSWSADRSSVAFTWSDSDTPAQLHFTNTEQVAPRALEEPNAWVEAELALASARTLRWSSYDGLEVEGVLILPPSWREGQRVPLMLNIHGGPAGVFSNSFRASYHVYAGMGFASLCPNVRGSSGYTDELLRGNMGDIGRGDYEDLMSGVDAVIARGFADPKRMGVRGWSYGGILGGVTITKTDRFLAASLGAMVSDWTSEYGPGFNHDVRLWYIGGTPWENPDGYRDASALTHVANVSTPTILFHGNEDATDTEPQSMMFFQALKDRGVPCRYLRFPREAHGLREPRHQRTRDVEELRWMRKYVLGDDDWEPWPAPAAGDPE